MSDYFNRVVGLLKRNHYVFLGQGSGKYQVWRQFSHDVTVPNRCVSRHTANGVMKAAKIEFSFSEDGDVSNVEYMEYMNHMSAKDEMDSLKVLGYG